MSDGFSDFDDYRLADKIQGQWARVRVLPEAPQYATLREICESGKPDKRAWRWDRDGHLWVSYHLFLDPGTLIQKTDGADK
jgi:hypothetical protein